MKIMVDLAEGSSINSIVSNEDGIDLAISKIGEDYATIDVTVDETILTEAEAKLCFTSDDLDDQPVDGLIIDPDEE